jgi:hypothetical protein
VLRKGPFNHVAPVAPRAPLRPRRPDQRTSA